MGSNFTILVVLYFIYFEYHHLIYDVAIKVYMRIIPVGANQAVKTRNPVCLLGTFKKDPNVDAILIVKHQNSVLVIQETDYKAFFFRWFCIVS
jgi:hypothetical protein